MYNKAPIRINGLPLRRTKVRRPQSVGWNGIQNYNHSAERTESSILKTQRSFRAIDRCFASRVRKGLKDGEFRLVYQPKINARTQEPTGVECLLRWDEATSLGLNTLDVITRAERDGSIVAITNWVFSEVSVALQKIQNTRFCVPVSINVSAALLINDQFISQLAAVPKETAKSVLLEITETAFIQAKSTAVTNVRTLKQAGFKFSLDDFGTGYSSLTQLQSLPLEEVKIDQSFIRDITTSHQSPILVRSTIDLAHALECKVVAEGVEDPAAMALLSVMGCDELQGYLIAKPMPLDSLVEWLNREKAEFEVSPGSPHAFFAS